MQLLMLGPVAIALGIVGLRHAIRDRAGAARTFALALGVLAVLYLASGGKPYYLASAWLPMIAVGAAQVRRPFPWTVAVAGAGLLCLPVARPVLPISVMARSPIPNMNGDQAERVGWPEWVDQVERIAEREGIDQIVVPSYGQAGALHYLGHRRLGVICGHNQHAFWPMPRPHDRFLSASYSKKTLAEYVESVREIGPIRVPYDVPNEERETILYLAEGATGSADRLLPKLIHFE